MSIMLFLGWSLNWAVLPILRLTSRPVDQLIGALSLVGWSLILFVLSTFVHELGHLGLGHLSGYRFSAFQVGPWRLIQRTGGYDIVRTGKFAGGQCLMDPPPFNDGRFPFVLYNLGGSLTNLFLAVMLWLMVSPETGQTTTLVLLRMFFATNIIIGFGNLLPIDLGVMRNDGARVAYRNDSDSRWVFWLILKFNHLEQQGVRLKDMPAEWFERKIPPRDLEAQSLASMRCLYLLDQMKLTEARRCLDDSLAQQPVPALRGMLQMFRFLLELLGQGDPAVLKRLETYEMRRFMSEMRSDPMVSVTHYAEVKLLSRQPLAVSEARNALEDNLRMRPGTARGIERQLMQRIDEKNEKENDNGFKDDLGL